MKIERGRITYFFPTVYDSVKKDTIEPLDISFDVHLEDIEEFRKKVADIMCIRNL
jgi:hypothetical protein